MVGTVREAQNHATEYIRMLSAGTALATPCNNAEPSCRHPLILSLPTFGSGATREISAAMTLSRAPRSFLCECHCPFPHMTVERHLAWNARRARGERLAKERLRGRDATVAAEQEINRLALLVDGAVEVVPLRFDRDIRFVHSPRGADGVGEPAPALLELRHVAGYPTGSRAIGFVIQHLGQKIRQFTRCPWMHQNPQ